MAKAKIKLKGFDKLAKKLDRVKASEINSAMRTPMNRGAAIITKDMKGRVKSNNKHVSKSIKSKSKTYRNGVVGRIIGPSVYSKNIKAGSKTDGQQVKSSGDVAKEAIDLEFGGDGQAAKPFVRPAFKASKNKVLKEISDGAKKAIEKKLTK